MNRIEFPFNIARTVSLVLIVLVSSVAESVRAHPCGGIASPDVDAFWRNETIGLDIGQMRADLDDGLAGHYTEISDSVNMRQFEIQTADQPGLSGNPGWWLGEHEGYHADGLFRLAWLGAPISHGGSNRTP
jgi:hypothetical protein